MVELKLRDYQVEALCSMTEAAKRVKALEGRDAAAAARTADRVLCIQPTGAGKTIQMLAFARVLFRRWRWSTLIIVPYRKLIYQTANTLKSLMPELSVGLIGDGHNSPDADVVVAVQASLAGKRLQSIKPDRFQLVVCDEAHHAAASGYKAILDHFSGAKLILGMTATYIRGDDISIASDQYFPNVIVWNTPRQLTSAGYLVEAYGYYKHTNISLDDVKIRGGNFVEGQLSHAVNTRERNDMAVDAWFEFMEGLPATAYCVDINHAKAMAERFCARGVPAAAVWGTMPDKDYERVMEDYHVGRILVLPNAKLLTEGWDAPLTSGVLMARPVTRTAANVLVPQMIGRALRPHEESGKTHAVIVEMRDKPRKKSGEEENLSISGLASYVGGPETDFVCGREALHHQASRNSVARGRMERRKLLEQLQSEETVKEQFDVIERLQSVSAYAWVPLGTTLYMPLDGDDFIEIIEETPCSFEVRLCVGGELFTEGTANLKRRAIEIADRWINRHIVNKSLLLNSAVWRKKEPSPEQIRYAQGLTRLPASLLKSLTCGQVSDLIKSARALLIEPQTGLSEVAPRHDQPPAASQPLYRPHAWQISENYF